MLRTGAPSRVEMAMRFRGGKALVPQVDRKASFFAQNLGECLSFQCLRTLVSGHVKWVADDNFRAAVFADKAEERFKVLLAVGSNEGENRLSSETKRVGDSNANAPVANVESHQAGRRFSHESDITVASRSVSLLCDPVNGRQFDIKI
jgi:hypothetical protein